MSLPKSANQNHSGGAMTIFINDKPADITLDTEKTLGDVLSGVEQWVSPSGNRIRGLSVDGKSIPADTLDREFARDIKEIKRLDVFINSWTELAAEALAGLVETCANYEKASFDERPAVFSKWENSPAARFLASDISDIGEMAQKTFKGEGLPVSELLLLVEERIREAAGTAMEISGIEALVEASAKRMEELPLDMQTGKDKRAAESTQLFSRMGEKLFRIFFILKTRGLSQDTFIIDNSPAKTFIEEFGASLKEIKEAYENNDTVLAGDIAEYELSPKLLKFYAALKNAAENGQ